MGAQSVRQLTSQRRQIEILQRDIVVGQFAKTCFQFRGDDVKPAGNGQIHRAHQCLHAGFRAGAGGGLMAAFLVRGGWGA